MNVSIPSEDESNLSIRFGRFLLKYATESIDDQGMLCWEYLGKAWNTTELFNEFIEMDY